MARAKKKVDFEENLKELEDIVRQLEDGDLPLEASLAAFEHGIKLTRSCQTALAAAQQKVQMLTERDGDSELSEIRPNSSS